MKAAWQCAVLLCLAAPAAAEKIAGEHDIATLSAAGLKLQVPSGWVYESKSHLVWASRDGRVLNELALSQVAAKDAFAAIHRASSPDMAVDDLAENYVANFHALPGALEVAQLLSSEPALVGGRPGFVVHLRYRGMPEAGGILFDQLTFGVATRDALVTATFRAPTLHYFEAGLPAFEAAVRSMTWR